MLRLAVVHQLVLSLVVGPMLCCCMTARLGHDAGRSSLGQHQTGQPEHKSCCGHDQSHPDGGEHDNGGHQPGEPAKCPCKSVPAVDVAAPGSSGSAVHFLELLASFTASLDAPNLSAGPVAVTAALSPLDSGPASLRADQILFVHHNLRC